MKRIAAAVMLLCLAGQATAWAGPRGASGSAPAGARHWVYPPGNSPLAADVGGRPITRFMVEQAYDRLKGQGEEIPADSGGVRTLVQQLIDKACLGWAVQDRGYRFTPAESTGYERIRLRMLRDYLYSLQQARAPRVTEAEVRALFEQQRRVFACHRLGVYRRDLADSLADRLRAGAPFESLAAGFNRDSQTRATLGRVQAAWTVGFVPALVESALVKLQPGQTSRPFQSPESGMWYVLRLDSISQRDPGPFEPVHDLVASTLAGSRVGAVRDSLLGAFMTRTDPRIHEAALALLIAGFDSTARAAAAADTGPTEMVELNPKLPKFTDAQRAMVLAESNYGPVTLGDVMSDIAGTSGVFRPKFKTEEEARRYIRVRACEPAITEAALAARLDTVPLVARDLFNEHEKILVERFVKTEVEDRSAVTDAAARAYFKAHFSDFDVPETASPRMLELADSALADSLYRVLQASRADFPKLADQFSDDYASRVAGGEVGRIARGYSKHDPAWEAAVFALPAGALSRPFRNGGSWYIVEMMAHNARRPRTWEEARKYAHQAAASVRQESMLQAILKASRRRHPVKTFPGVIRSIDFRRGIDWNER